MKGWAKADLPRLEPIETRDSTPTSIAARPAAGQPRCSSPGVRVPLCRLATLLWLTSSLAQGKPAALPYRVVAETDLATLLGAQNTPIVVDARKPDARGTWGLKCDTCSTVEAPFDFGDTDKAKAAALKKFTEAIARSKPLAEAKASGQEVLVVCLVGGRSGAAAAELVELGYQPVLLENGLQGLTNAANVRGTKPKG